VNVNIIFPGDRAPNVYPYIIDTATHAVSRVTLPGEYRLGTGRNLAWADNHTLLVFQGDTPGSRLPAGSVPTTFYSYDITTHALTTLPGITRAATDGVVRCSTLFYLEVTPLVVIGTTSDGRRVYRGTAFLHRYNLAAHTEIGSPFSIGQTWDEEGSFGNYQWPGWDVTRDGTRLAFQGTEVSFSASASGPTIRSHFSAATAGGSGTTPILNAPVAVTAETGASLAISPNGAFVAVTQAYPTPDIASGSMTGGSVRFYTPDAASAPAWLANSDGFDANSISALAGDIHRFLLSTPLDAHGRAPGATIVADAQLPATLA
jgi:hypothetical protein